MENKHRSGKLTQDEALLNARLLTKYFLSRPLVIRLWKFSKRIFKSLTVLSLIASFLLNVFLGWAYFQYQKGNLGYELSCGAPDVERASRSVVLIEGKNASGSGFFVDGNHIVTNNHVVDHNPITRILIGGEDIAVASHIIGTDSLRDIAVIEARNPTDSGPLVGSTRPAHVVDDVFAIGFPAGRNLTISKGIISAFTKDDYDDRQFIQTDASIIPGNSGGPLVDICGKVVGMNTQTLYGQENVGFAIEYSQLTARIQEIISASSKATPEETLSSYPSEQAEVVAKYYTTLSGGDLEGAYDFYSTGRKLRLPYDNWKIGLENTVLIRLISVSLTDKPNTVNAHFYATERKADSPWEWTTSEFEGTWTLVRENGLWKMNDSNIKEIRKVDNTQ